MESSAITEAPGYGVASNEVHFWSLPKKGCELDALYREGKELLSTEERVRSQSFANKGRARRYQLGRILLRRGLAAHLGKDPSSFVIGIGNNGKPILDHPKCEELGFSLSHSVGETILAVARAKGVGVDLEPWTRAVTALKIGRRFFAIEERQRLDLLGDEAEIEALSLWTLKESVIKAIGSTIWSGLSQVSLSRADPKGGWQVSPPVGNSEDWTLVLLRFRRDYCLAVALWQPMPFRAPLTWKRHTLSAFEPKTDEFEFVSVSARI